MPVGDASVRSAPRPESRWPAMVFVGGLLTSAWAWWRFAWPVMSGAAMGRHVEHFPLVYAHMLGGTTMLAVGAAAVYLGWTRTAYRYHRWFGYAYLSGGTAGASLGLALSLRNPHHIGGITVATGTLAIVWLAVAALALRAARNRRFDAHRDWMIRSYVLTWTFAGCRVAGRVPALESLGDPGGAAIVWLSWIVPLVLCELALHWTATARVTRASRLA
jgi:hypothetical protein